MDSLGAKADSVLQERSQFHSLATASARQATSGYNPLTSFLDFA